MTTLPKKAGRPRKIKTPEEFRALAQDYFDWCDNWVDKVTGRVGRNYMITGLALHLGLSSRQELYDYCGYEGFEDIATAARLKVEGDYERRLDSAKFVGAIFALKNMGWRDEKHLDVKSSDGSMTPNINVTLDVSKLSTDVLAQVWGALIVTEREPATH